MGLEIEKGALENLGRFLRVTYDEIASVTKEPSHLSRGVTMVNVETALSNRISHFGSTNRASPLCLVSLFILLQRKSVEELEPVGCHFSRIGFSPRPSRRPFFLRVFPIPVSRPFLQPLPVDGEVSPIRLSFTYNTLVMKSVGMPSKVLG
jgi:hypothetical protein